MGGSALKRILYVEKTRIKWLKEGDCNSRFYHMTINWKHHKNMLRGIFIGRCWVEESNRVREKVKQFFMRRFEESSFERPRLDGVEFKIINQEANAKLVARFEEDEVRAAVWDCGSSKSPGLDGLNFKFIKEFWDVMKMDVLRFLDEFHANGHFPKGSKASFLALIPKVQDPQNLNDYIAISLIGCIYKIVAKILTKRLKKVMATIIDEWQSAFIEGRHLLHIVVIANEVSDEAKRGRKSCLVFKVDYEKHMILYAEISSSIC